jgi:hypothetical protein
LKSNKKLFSQIDGYAKYFNKLELEQRLGVRRKITRLTMM